MQISDILSPALVQPELKSQSRDECLEEMVLLTSKSRPEIEVSKTLRILIERERLGSTGIGNGIAIPHAKLDGLKTTVVCLARSEAGVDFGALDRKKTHLFVLLLAPAHANAAHLNALARASRLLNNSEFREHLMSMPPDPDLIYEAVQNQDSALDRAAGEKTP